MRRSLSGRQMAWRVFSRCFRPTVDTFITLVFFGVGGTLLTVLWTFEPRPMDQEEVRHQLVEEMLHESRQLRDELNRLNSVPGNDVDLWDRPLGSRRRVTESLKRRTQFDVGDDGERPEVVLRNTSRTRTAKRSVLSAGDSVALLKAPEGLGSVRTLTINSNDDYVLQKMRSKLLSDFTSKPEVDRPSQRSNNTRQLVSRNDSLVGSRRWCSVYDTTPEVDESFNCVRLLIKPPTTVCLAM